METDMEQEVTLDPESQKNELAENELPAEFEDQKLEAGLVLIWGEEWAICHFLSLEPIWEENSS